MEKFKAKIFKNGGSQAVRLPKDCRFPENQKEVVVRRNGSQIILEPADEWSDEFKKTFGAWPDEIPRPKHTPISKSRNVFD